MILLLVGLALAFASHVELKALEPMQLVFDSSSGRTLFAGIHAGKHKKSNSQEILQLSALCKLASRYGSADEDLLKSFRKWMRRKESRLSGCLADLLAGSTCIDKTIFVYEWPYARELELVGGLSRLAEQGKGRCLIFHGDAGEGKTTLLRQIYLDQISRGSRVLYFLASKEEKPYQSIKNLLRCCVQDWGLTQDLPREFTEENVLSAFLKIFQNATNVFVILLDGLQDMDVYSRRSLLRIFRHLTDIPLLFLAASRNPVKEAVDSAVLLRIPKPALKQIEESILVPLWQEKQRKSYFEQIYQRTSGNALFFYEYLVEVIRQGRKNVEWKEGEWSFVESRVPGFPEALLDFYWDNAPELSDKERSFLQLAAVKGEIFEVTPRDQKLLPALVEKNVLVESSGRFRFRNRLFAEAILNKLEPRRLKRIHRELAEELSNRSGPESFMMLARHSLKAGEPSHALDWTCRAIRDLGSEIEPLALSLLEELETCQGELTDSEKIDLCTLKADLYYRRGKYLAAASAYRGAWDLAGKNSKQRFSVGVSLVECSLLQEDINSAQEFFGHLTAMLPVIQDDRDLFRYYLARGLYAHYRGPRDSGDFQKAFALAEKIGDESLLAHGYRRSAWFHLQEGRLTEANSHARKALRLARLARDAEEMGSCYKIFASIAWRKSRHQAAEALMKKSIRAFQKSRNSFGSAGVWNLLGNVYVEKYRFAEAIRCFEKAIHLFGHLDHPHEVSFAQFNMGLVYLEMGRLKEAEKIFLRCRDLDKRSGNRWFFAYDLRALAVYCILQGYPRKAERLLKKTIEICKHLSADGDLLQTKLILLFLYLEQRNFRSAHALVSFLEQSLPDLREPMTVAEIHHLLAFYYGFTNEIEDAIAHLKKSNQLARRIQHFKLIGKNTILGLIFRGTAPRSDDPEFRRAVHYFRKSKNQLEFSDYLLMLYESYPGLLKEKLHQRRCRRMETIYRDLQIKSRLHAIRKLNGVAARPHSGVEPEYEWWNGVLELFTRHQDLQSLLTAVLEALSSELASDYLVIQYLNGAGTFDRVTFSRQSDTTSAEDLPGKIFEQVFRRKESICMDVRIDAELSRNSWVILNEVRSILAVPFLKNGQLLGLWYFERREDASVFGSKDLQKVTFFARVCLPLLETAINRGAPGAEEKFVMNRALGDFVGSGRRTQQLVRLVEKVAPLDVSVLIQGESGTGKELIARSIHRLGKRARGPFVALNCSAIPETLIESELFGHSRGAFTGAVSAKAGSVERANGGTLFLDEIGDLSPSAQAKLLRVIQEREIQRLGETAIRKIDVRFLFATHKDLPKMIQAGQYREDLFYRISGYILTAAPLRDRKEDIPLLTRYFIEKYSRAFGKQNIRISAGAMKQLCDYSWPGNIRELENLIQTALVNAESDNLIDCEALPSFITDRRLVEKVNGISLEEGREEFDREFVRQALNRNRWNKSMTAKELKITRQGLINLIHRLKLEPK